MARCPTCHRRLAPGAPCPRDGGLASQTRDTSEPSPPSDPGIQVAGLLGAGASGSVWEAWLNGPQDHPQRVALKVSHGADSATVTRFRREAAALEAVGAPHVPALLRSGSLSDGRTYLAMEWVVGGTLAEALASLANVPSLATVSALGGALLDAVAALHARGVFHRDLKPENVLPGGADTPRPVAKLIDFGLAFNNASVDAGASTVTGVAAGTPEYMAPERIAGEDGDLRSDVYALGIILFELLTLRPPFVGELREIEYAHLSFRPPPPSRFAPVPELLEAVVLRCLAKEPARRFLDARALKRAFEDALADSAPATVDASSAARGRALSPGTRQKVAVIFLDDLEADAVEIQGLVQPFGGLLAYLAADRCVCAFTHRAGDHPGQRALAAAEAIVRVGLARRLIVDIETVTVKARAHGPPRIASAAFSDASRFPRTDDPQAILVTTAARETLPPLPCKEVEGRPNVFALLPRPDEDLFKTIEVTSRDSMGLLFGRDDELKALFADASRAVADRRPRVASVLGEQGFGKTRLRYELAHLFGAGLPDAAVIELDAREAVGESADELLAELMRRSLDLPRQPPSSAARELLMERLGGTVAESAAGGLALGWFSLSDPAVRSLQAAPGVLRANTARAGMAAVSRLAQRRPVIVLVDDAHWADDALLDALEQATVSELPLWVCAFARPTFASSRPGWGQRAGGGHTVRLGSLDRASAGELCRYLLEPASQVPQPVLDRLVDRTQGVPLLIHDLIRGLRREGLIRREVGGVWVVASDVIDRLSDSPLTEWLASRELD